LAEVLASPDDQPVSLEVLKKYWQEFAEKRKEEGKSSEYQLLNQEIIFTEGRIIHIELTNAIQQNFLESIRTDLLQFLRKKLQNNQLTIDAKLLKAEQKEMIYTATEKFNHLAKDHPHLNLLKDELGLDTDF
jgi:DNA polymerase-3 subunit gamma/tau